MKKTIIPILLFTILVSVQSSAQVTLIWNSDALAINPESIVYDDVREFCYISNFNFNNGDGTNYNENYISKFNLKGELLEKKMISNLSSPTGLCLHNDKLYIVERFGVVKFDLKQNKVETRYRIKSAFFLNDVAVDINGNIYVTVSNTNIIYKIADGKVEKWVESDQIFNPNGIIVDGDKIIVGVCSENTVKSIAIDTKKISTVAVMGPDSSGVIDGIKKYKDGYLISHYDGIISSIQDNGKITELSNTVKEETTCADFEFIENKKLIVAPDLKNSRVQLYKIE